MFDPMILSGLMVAVICLGVLSSLMGKNPSKHKGKGKAQYISAERLLTPTEAIAFRQLHQRIKGHGYICPKVRIADLVSVDAKGDRSAFLSAFQKISQKHVDFAVMTLTGEILFAVEIDDRSHERKDRKTRDLFVDAVFEEAGIPLVRIKPGMVASSEELTDVLSAGAAALLQEDAA